MVAPKPVVRQFAWAKQNMDLHASSLSQCLLDLFCRGNYFVPHLESLKQHYLSRRNLMLKALERYASPGVHWNTPQGGYYVWCHLPETINTTNLLTKAAERLVAFVPGEAFFSDGQGQNNLRLNFTYPAEDQINEGIKRLMQVIKETSAISLAEEDLNIEISPII
jgi:DNA-binding transcriptional MocR family regulator